MSKRKSREERKAPFTYKKGKKVLVNKEKATPKRTGAGPKDTANESSKKS